MEGRCAYLSMACSKAGFKFAREPETYARTQSVGSLHKLCEKGQLYDAFQAVDHSAKRGMRISVDILTVLVQRCTEGNDLMLGRQFYSLIVRNKLQLTIGLGLKLIRMFGLCGGLPEAHKVFCSLCQQNVYSWTAIISAHAHHGQAEQAIAFYQQMKISAVKPSSYTFVAVLKACVSIGALDQCKLVHADIMSERLESDLFVGSTLVDMYAEFGSLEDARRVFDKLYIRDVVLWNAMIGGYSQHGHSHEALQLYQKMQVEGTEPNEGTFLCILKSCSLIAALHQGMLIHTDIVERGLESDLFVGSILVDMYVKCSSIKNARKVFDELPIRDVVAWNAMIVGYVKHEDGDEALKLFHKMQNSDTKPDKVTFACILKACSKRASINLGKLIHADIRKRRLESDLFVASALVDMYAKCGNLDEARKVFDNLLVRDVVSWTAMIEGYAEHGQANKALKLFEQMQKLGIEPNGITYMSALKACASLAALDQGKLIHADIKQRGLESNLLVGSTLIDMYAKCGSLEEACKVFDLLEERDVVAYNEMIAGYAEHGQGQEALRLFRVMQCEGTKPDKVTFVCALKASASVVALDQGRLIHVEVIEQELQSDPFVGSSLVDMYAKCGSLMDASQVFDKMSAPDIVSWNAIIAGHVENGLGQKALHLLYKLKQEGKEPNDVTYMCTLKACSSIAALDQGKLIHKDILSCGLESDRCIGSTLLDMYAKCGSLEDAHDTFNRLPSRGVVDWNAMIAGLANHGHLGTAQHCFESMQQEGTQPNGVTFLSLLYACSHAGLVWEGHQYLKSMSKDFDLVPALKHYVCMIDLLGRVGCLAEAEDLVLKMPFPADTVVWIALLGSCAKYGNVEVGRRAFDCLMKLDCRNAAGLVLMSNIYAINHMWEDVQKLQEMRACNELGKLYEKSWIEINNKAHELTINNKSDLLHSHAFRMNNKSHPSSDAIHAQLKKLRGALNEAGHVPHVDMALQGFAVWL